MARNKSHNTLLTRTPHRQRNALTVSGLHTRLRTRGHAAAQPRSSGRSTVSDGCADDESNVLAKRRCVPFAAECILKSLRNLNSESYTYEELLDELRAARAQCDERFPHDAGTHGNDEKAVFCHVVLQTVLKNHGLSLVRVPHDTLFKKKVTLLVYADLNGKYLPSKAVQKAHNFGGYDFEKLLLQPDHPLHEGAYHCCVLAPNAKNTALLLHDVNFTRPDGTVFATNAQPELRLSKSGLPQASKNPHIIDIKRIFKVVRSEQRQITLPFEVRNVQTKQLTVFGPTQRTLHTAVVQLQGTIFAIEHYVNTCIVLMRDGYNFPSVSSPMTLFGATIGPTSDDYKYNGTIVPRANAKSRPGSPGHKVLQHKDVRKLAQGCEQLVLEYLAEHDPEARTRALKFKENTAAHPELRVCDTIFSAMALVGDLNDGENHVHVDANDVCSCIVMLGGPSIQGGDTVYYNGRTDKEPGEVVHREKHVHGKVQIFPFETVPHAGSLWHGPRGIISFYLNSSMVKHFEQHGSMIYAPWLAQFKKSKQRKKKSKKKEFKLSLPGAEQIAPGIYLIKNFAANVLRIDADTLLPQLLKDVPVRAAGDDITPGQLQWISGSNQNLMFRGHVLPRQKIWLQDGSTKEYVLIYRYTGYTYPVAPATSDWNEHPLLKSMPESFNEFMSSAKIRKANHAIITAYEDETANIGMHSDKMDTLHPDGVITVLKLGPASRRFLITSKDKETVVFDDVIHAGDLLLMTAKANAETMHGVPAETTTMGLSGSICWRTVQKKMTPSELAAKIADTEKGRKRRAEDKQGRPKKKVNSQQHGHDARA